MVVGDQCVMKPLERHSNSPLPYFQLRKVPSSTTVRLFGAKLLRSDGVRGGAGARARVSSRLRPRAERQAELICWSKEGADLSARRRSIGDRSGSKAGGVRRVAEGGAVDTDEAAHRRDEAELLSRRLSARQLLHLRSGARNGE